MSEITHGGQAMMMVATLRAEHVPAPGSGLGLYCDRCEGGDYAASQPDWPCRTAEVVFTAAEIRELTEAHRHG